MLTVTSEGPLWIALMQTLLSASSRASASDADAAFSRACGICDAVNPRARVCLTACGHLLCLACALQIELRGRIGCPMCREDGGWVEMREQREGGFLRSTTIKEEERDVDVVFAPCPEE